jgi:predicted ATPase
MGNIGLQYGSARCHCRVTFHGTKLIVLTGGPGAGKTAALELARLAFCEHVAILPEAASVVFGGGFPRHDTRAGQEAAQRTIFHLQREMERLVVEEKRVAVALCDRGTIDGLAYWPGDEARLWADVGSSRDVELPRYAAVVHLRTPGAEQGYDHSNVLRIESPDEAIAIDRRIAALWDEHANRTVVAPAADFLEKMRIVLTRVRDELPRCCRSHPLPGER